MLSVQAEDCGVVPEFQTGNAPPDSAGVAADVMSLWAIKIPKMHAFFSVCFCVNRYVAF